jgi:hypothetical protein
MPHYNWKRCKVCLTENGVCLEVCKNCGNDRFWPIPEEKKPRKYLQEFKMTNA